MTDNTTSSSTACSSSSGISSCETDDDDSSDDDDDSYDEDDNDNVSVGCSQKWTTTDGYNLTTFNQTECGSWAIGQPLPLPLWAAKSKQPLVIDKVRNY